jgi:hypothetical protein
MLISKTRTTSSTAADLVHRIRNQPTCLTHLSARHRRCGVTTITTANHHTKYIISSRHGKERRARNGTRLRASTSALCCLCCREPLIPCIDLQLRYPNNTLARGIPNPHPTNHLNHILYFFTHPTLTRNHPPTPHHILIPLCAATRHQANNKTASISNMCGGDKRGCDSSADCSRTTGDGSSKHECDQTAAGAAECCNDLCCSEKSAEDGDECCSGHHGHEHAADPNPDDECCSDDEPCVCDGKSPRRDWLPAAVANGSPVNRHLRTQLRPVAARAERLQTQGSPHRNRQAGFRGCSIGGWTESAVVPALLEQRQEDRTPRGRKVLLLQTYAEPEQVCQVAGCRTVCVGLLQRGQDAGAESVLWWM